MFESLRYNILNGIRLNRRTHQAFHRWNNLKNATTPDALIAFLNFLMDPTNKDDKRYKASFRYEKDHLIEIIQKIKERNEILIGLLSDFDRDILNEALEPMED